MFNSLITPSVIYKLHKFAALPLLALFIILCSFGIWQALIASPADYQQGDAMRIMYIHVPSAWLALMTYGSLALCGVSYLVWKNPVADALALASAPVGACFCLITLLTGCIWGKPIWGTWWVWDARLTSMLILFFMYISYIQLADMFTDTTRAAKVRAYVALIGAFNLPIIKYSVEWWNTLHQPATFIRKDGMAIDPSMALPLFLMFGAFCALSVSLVLIRAKTELLSKKIARSRFTF